MPYCFYDVYVNVQDKMGLQGYITKREEAKEKGDDVWLFEVRPWNGGRSKKFYIRESDYIMTSNAWEGINSKVFVHWGNDGKPGKFLLELDLKIAKDMKYLKQFSDDQKIALANEKRRLQMERERTREEKEKDLAIYNRDRDKKDKKTGDTMKGADIED